MSKEAIGIETINAHGYLAEMVRDNDYMNHPVVANVNPSIRNEPFMECSTTHTQYTYTISNTENETNVEVPRINVNQSEYNEAHLMNKCEMLLFKLQCDDNFRHNEWMKHSVVTFKEIVVDKTRCFASMQKSDMFLCLQELHNCNKNITYYKSWNISRLYEMLICALKTSNQTGITNEQTPELVSMRQKKSPDKLSKILS